MKLFFVYKRKLEIIMQSLSELITLSDQSLQTTFGATVGKSVVYELEALTQALQYVCIGLTSSTIFFQTLQFGFMIQGAATDLMFEIVWLLMTLIYPTSSLVIMLSQKLE